MNIVNPGTALPLAAALAARLLTPLPAPPILTARQLAALTPPPAAAQPQEISPGPAHEPALLEPNASGIIDLAAFLTAEQRAADGAQPANPFRLRYHPPLAARTVTLTVGGIMRSGSSDRDCCVLNDQVLRAGESFEGLILEKITSDQIILRAGSRRLALPASDQSVTLRLPP